MFELILNIKEFFDNYLVILQGFANSISVISFLIGWSIILHHRFFKRTVSLQNGKYRCRIKRRHFNSTDLTIIVSNLYFQGGMIPGELRQEIFAITGTIGKKL